MTNDDKQNDRQGVALSEKRILEIAQPWFGEETKHLRLHLVEFALAVARAAYPSTRASSSRAEVERIVSLALDHCYGRAHVSNDMIQRTTDAVLSAKTPNGDQA